MNNNRLATALLMAILAISTLALIASGCGGQTPAKPTMEILSPPSGSEVGAGEEIQVEYRAADPVAVVRVELEVGGQIVDSQNSPVAEGQPSLTGILRWTPETPGTYSLVAYAYNRDRVASAPVGVNIIVVGQPTATPTATASPTRTPAPSPTPTTQPSASFIVNALSGKCIDVSGKAGTANGTRLQIWDCESDNPNTDQRWYMRSDGFIVNSLSGRCIDVSGKAGTANNTPLQLWDCEFGDPAHTDQRWSMSGGFIVNSLSGKCLDVSGKPGTANGTALQIWDCESDDPNTDQRWTLQ